MEPAVRGWLSSPQGMSRIGYDGFANGGDGPRKQGYHRTGANDPEAWEPAPLGAALTPATSASDTLAGKTP